MVDQDVYEQEIGLIRTKRRWIAEQRERLGDQLADLQSYTLSREGLEALRDRLANRLEGATFSDRRFVLEALGVQVIAQSEGTWTFQVAMPTEQAAQLQTASSVPSYAPTSGP